MGFEITDTLVLGPEGVFSQDHPFFPGLSVEFALREGGELDGKTFRRVLRDLKSGFDQGYARWSKEYPPDYDSTIVSRNVFNYLGIEARENLDLSFAKAGGVYTYLGGLSSKPNNSVDLVINLRILDYLGRNLVASRDFRRLKEFMLSKKDLFFKPVGEISKYYLSEGFLIYWLAKTKNILGIDLEGLVEKKRQEILHPTDRNLVSLALGSEESFDFSDPLELFQHPRRQLRFSCLYFDKVVRSCLADK